MLPTLCTCHPDMEAANAQLIDARGATDSTLASVKDQCENSVQALRTVEEERDDSLKDVSHISISNEYTAACLANVCTRTRGKASDQCPTPTSGARSKCADLEGSKVHGQGTWVGAARYYSCDKGPCRAINFVFMF